MSEPETWLGNIQKAADDYCESGCCKTCADMARKAAGPRVRYWDADVNEIPCCDRCGAPHSGECLRGDR